MDEVLQQRIQAARDAGYSDEEIQAALGSTGVSSVPSATPATPAVPILSPAERSRMVQEDQDLSARNTGEQWTTGLTTAGMGVAAAGVPVLAYKGAKAILRPAAQAGSELARRGVAAAENIGKTMAETEGRVAANQAARAAQAVRPVAPTPVSAAAPAAGPVAPAQPAMPPQAANAARGAAQAAQPGNWMQQALQMARQYAPAMARVGTGLGAATYSGGLNTNEQQELARRRAMEVEQARRQGWIQ